MNANRHTRSLRAFRSSEGRSGNCRLDAHQEHELRGGPVGSEPLLTIREVCAALAISRQTLYRLLERRRPGRDPRLAIPEVPAGEIQSYLDQRKGVMR